MDQWGAVEQLPSYPQKSDAAKSETNPSVLRLARSPIVHYPQTSSCSRNNAGRRASVNMAREQTTASWYTTQSNGNIAWLTVGLIHTASKPAVDYASC
ncbi:hypothetical protein AAFF_G00095620 [Aldrovandia affinis]|uniref:Uncharacterized protein n=1 Tax=Aldrovandia affinis TaxID=143900 RepID=A0AAD7RVK3_9TELE|nr:hypothetical protein AAFF_G00095620 [Aldrovandia affinis]